jgi:hypothetical protein
MVKTCKNHGFLQIFHPLEINLEESPLNPVTFAGPAGAHQRNDGEYLGLDTSG